MAAKRRADELGVAAVARRAGVSTATVSNTLNRPELVAPATQARVRAAIEELQFVPNSSASALRRGSGRLIGLLVPDIVNPFYAAIAKAVAASAFEHGYLVALCVSGDDPDTELEHIRRLAEQRAAGALVVPLGADTSRLDRLRLVDSHPVLIDRRWPIDDGCSTAIDDVRGGFLAMEHLICSTDGPIVLVNGPRGIPQCADREAGARAAIAAHGADPARLSVVEVLGMTIEGGASAVQQFADHPPAGVFCANDHLAVGVIRALSRAGVAIPGDVAVVGYGDLSLGAESPLPLTTVVQPTDRLGCSAVELLLAEVEMRSGHVHESRLLAPSLVVRASAP